MNIVMLVLIVVVVVAIWRPAIVRSWLEDLDFEKLFSGTFDFLLNRMGDVYKLFHETLGRIAIALEKVFVSKIQGILSDKADELEKNVEFPKYLPSGGQ